MNDTPLETGNDKKADKDIQVVLEDHRIAAFKNKAPHGLVYRAWREIMEHRQINDNYKAIAERLIETEPELAYIKDSRVKITYLESDANKKNGPDKAVLGECEKVAAKNRWAITSDFTITVYVNNCIGLSEEQMSTLLFHELLHIGIEQGPDGDELYSVRKHDLEDFKYIIDRFGTDWAGQDKNSVNG